MKKFDLVAIFLLGLLIGSVLIFRTWAQQYPQIQAVSTSESSQDFQEINQKLDRILSNQERILTEIHRVWTKIQ